MSNESSPPQLDPAALQRALKTVVYRIPGMDRVRVHPNLRYTNVAEPRLLMDIYVPADVPAAERRPTVLLIHGAVPGPLPVKDMGSFRSWGRLIAAGGCVAVTFTHRLQWPLSQFTEAAADVRSAIDYVRSNASEFGIDADRLCVVAWSAGGPLLTVSIQDRREYVRCQVALYALLDIRGADIVDAEQFSLTTYLRDTVFPPIFVARAGRDAIPALNERLDRFIAEALTGNVPVTLVNHPAGVHGFDIDNDDDRSREIIRAALEFMRVHLSQARLD